MSKPKNAVFIVKTPPDWRPSSVHTQPPEILGGQFYNRNIALIRALIVAQEFNRTKLGEGNWTGEWAIVVKGLRCNGKYHDHTKPKAPAPAGL